MPKASRTAKAMGTKTEFSLDIGFQVGRITECPKSKQRWVPAGHRPMLCSTFRWPNNHPSLLKERT
jgi:hypothetical protein